MIKFFRKIRQRLLNENKLSKYLLYATGEIILVVIGILIALQINNWNEDRKNKKLENTYISRFLDDIEEEESFIQTFVQYNEDVSNYANAAILYFEDPETAMADPKQSLIDLYQASQFSDARPTASTYKELNTSGQINLLQDYDLRTSIINFYELDWSNSVILTTPNRYRESLRGLMPNSIQKDIRRKCGDIYIETKKSIAVSLPEVCTIEIKDEEAKMALDLLLKDPKIKKDLNFLIGNLDSKLALMGYVQGQLSKLKNDLENYKASYVDHN